ELKDKDIPHRSKIRELVLQRWKETFQTIRRELFHSPGRISFTVDIWSSRRRFGYITVTAHWLA
ncbi:hypothetical protein BV25DRAFT_1776292, partial [Artomyces pyxidatus]